MEKPMIRNRYCPHGTKSLVLSAFAALTLLMLSPAAGAQTPESGAGDAGERKSDRLANETVEVVKIQHAQAEHVADLIRSVTGLFLIADERTNSVLVRLTPEQREVFRDLLGQIDRPVEGGVPPQEEIAIEVFQLEHIEATEELARKLTALFTDPQRQGQRVRRQGTPGGPIMLYPNLPRIAVDATTNQLVVRAHPPELEVIAGIIEQLDQPVAGAAAAKASGQFQVRLVWLVSGLDEQNTADVPPDLAEVVRELEQYGITGLRRAFQTVVRVNAGDEFYARFEAELDQRWRMVFSGEMTAAADRHAQALPELQMNIEGDAEKLASRRADRIQLRTTIKTKPGHFVVLGVTPIAQLESVFVLQVIELP